MTVFNADNVGTTKGYPLFLGDDLGLTDTINVTYPILDELYEQQLAQLWNHREVDLTQDRMDMLNMTAGEVDLLTKTVSWQWAADSIASRSIAQLLTPFTSNPELESLLNLWTFFETIHAKTYSHIVKQTFADPTALLEETYKNEQLLTRAGPVVHALDNLSSSLGTKEDILKGLTALLALEAIAFNASFAVTFAMAERGKIQGTAQLVKLIARDELLHVSFHKALFDILKRDPAWADAFSDTSEERLDIITAVVHGECVWADYLFTEGRQVIGLSPTLLQQYIEHLAEPVYKLSGFGTVDSLKNPLPFMDKWLDSSKMQVAPQELQKTDYQVGTITDDSLDISFD